MPAMMWPMPDRIARRDVSGARWPAGTAALLMLMSLLAACGFGAASDAERLALDPLTLERTGWPNDYLVCPAERCTAPADRTAPVLDLPALDQLRLWEEMAAMSERTRILGMDETALTLHVEQRSRIFGFIDTIVVHVLPFDDGLPTAERSTFAAYSRSELGFGDMGVNQARLESWIAQVEAVAGTR
jgi:hypothetical protein